MMVERLFLAVPRGCLRDCVIVVFPDHTHLLFLVVNPITVGNFALHFNCTPAGRTSDSMTVPT